AATNKNLITMVENNEFRQDLYYRINVIKISLPPLRHRMEDIPYLVDQFISRLNLRRNKMIQGISPGVLAAFMAHDFPGNIRELENIIEHAFVLCGKELIAMAHLPPSLVAKSRSKADDNKNPVVAAQIQMITDALKRNNNNRNAAARDLGIHKSTLFRRIKKLGIQL
ncbi:MAG: sigma 54-interacting transcriptional regulator, partial [Desulfobacterales bacterium]|nr:sigma 54-interacting transcriptional regulator [Desulfobacterales bacterium]